MKKRAAAATALAALLGFALPGRAFAETEVEKAEPRRAQAKAQPKQERPRNTPSRPANKPAPPAPPTPAPTPAPEREAPPAPAPMPDGPAETRPAPAPSPESRPAEAVPAPSPTPGVHPAPPPAREEQVDYRPAPPPAWRRWFPSTVLVPVSPFWWGWSWGWGYYPIYPRPEHRPKGEEVPQLDPDRITTTLRVVAAGAEHAGVAGVALAIDGKHLGFQASIDGIGLDTSQGETALDGVQALGWGTLHATWSLVSEKGIRVRLEVGGSMLSMADAGSLGNEPYAGNVVFGPNVGVSGHLGLVGPIGLEGHARVTPSPVVITDSRLALAVRGGPLAFTAGYRTIQVNGDGREAPTIDFAGPEVGLAFRF